MIRERACVRIDTIQRRCCIFIGVVAIRQVQGVESMSLSTYIERWKRVYIYIYTISTPNLGFKLAVSA